MTIDQLEEIRISLGYVFASSSFNEERIDALERALDKLLILLELETSNKPIVKT